MKKSILISVLAASISVSAGISGLNGEYRNGQVFLRWQEHKVGKTMRLKVWSSASPITRDKLNQAKNIASHLNVNSALDWWLDPDSFLRARSNAAKSEEIFAGNVTDTGKQRQIVRGFVIKDGGKPIAPSGGLHVHTPSPAQQGKRYFAITLHKGFSDEVIGFSATDKPIEVGPGKASPIRISGTLGKDSAKNMPLVIRLHGRGGGVGVDAAGRPNGTHVIYVDRNLAWREGIPFKFAAMIKKGKLEIALFDRIWTGRKLTRAESSDNRDYVPAIATFWLGYNTNIAISNKGPEFRWDNYTERYILHIIRWAQEYLGADKNRTYITGGSMGGTGTVQMVTHFPEIFAAARACVPIYAFNWKKMDKKTKPNAWRMSCSIGFFSKKNPARLPNGMDLVEYTDGAKNIARPEIDMPPLLATNGRNDASIPWINNPPFYRAANAARQMFCVYWNNGPHGMTRQVPADFVSEADMFRFRLNESYPAFSNYSDDRNPGNGSPADGDLIGWINRGFKWENIVDTPQRYEITVSAAYKGIKYPVNCDITIRRRQNFKFAPGTVINVSVNGSSSTVKIDEHGLLTVKNVRFESSAPVKLIFSK